MKASSHPVLIAFQGSRQCVGWGEETTWPVASALRGQREEDNFSPLNGLHRVDVWLVGCLFFPVGTDVIGDKAGTCP